MELFKKGLTFLLVCTYSIFAGFPWPDFDSKYLPTHLSILNPPSWMSTQVENSLDYYKSAGISRSKITDFYQSCENICLVKFTIQDNQVYVEQKIPDNIRANRYKTALSWLCEHVGLPNMSLLIAVDDTLFQDYEVPIFVMAKDSHLNSLILLPDFEAIAACYQVLQKKDITKYSLLWESKKPVLIWRGGSVQGREVTLENYQTKSRLILCGLGLQYPNMINAKITLWGHQHLQTLPDVRKFGAGLEDLVSYEEQLQYKYHILIDGVTCAYTASGWKWFTNSLIFKVDSPAIQWYYSELQPYVHYIPVKANLEDLIAQLRWAQEHDAEAKNIADNARRFAKEHITVDCNLLYLYCLIVRYSQLLVD